MAQLSDLCKKEDAHIEFIIRKKFNAVTDESWDFGDFLLLYKRDQFEWMQVQDFKILILQWCKTCGRVFLNEEEICREHGNKRNGKYESYQGVRLGLYVIILTVNMSLTLCFIT